MSDYQRCTVDDTFMIPVFDDLAERVYGMDVDQIVDIIEANRTANRGQILVCAAPECDGHNPESS